jgi:hypothetical protein
MKTIRLPLFAAALALFALPTFAADAPPANDPTVDKAIEAARGAVYARKSVVLEGMLELTPEQQTAFSPVLKAYDDELMAIGDRRIALIKEYAAYYNASSLDDKNAERLLKATVKCKQDQLKLFSKYFDKAKKVIGVAKAAEFIQVENAFAAALDTKLALEMPRISSAMKQ